MSAVTHAERLCAFLPALRPRRGDTVARAWLHGRTQEIEVFVRQLASDLRGRKVTVPSAALALTTYLDALHQGMIVHFGEHSPRCCRDESFATAVPPDAAGAITAIRPAETDSTPTEVYARPSRPGGNAAATRRRGREVVLPDDRTIAADALLARLPVGTHG